MSLRLGWRLTGHHAHCRRVAWLTDPAREIACECPCHQKEKP